ncbi:MAG: SGNH/GDSL hydrolase family protein [Clostridia bacterium]|nr:SGNH/GDSL hydrolase family protein [Clostridia bacterium]
MKIEKIDGNFKVESTIKREGIRFFDAKEKPFRICGLMREDDRYVRMPGEVAARVNDGVKDLNSCTAGGRVRFVTDSPYVAIAVKYNVMYRMPHCANTGGIGFDLYADDLYAGTFIPGDSDTLESVVDLPDKGTHTMTIHFPLYGGVDELFIGLKEGSVLLPPPDYRTEKPVVFYGSSITQGGCASRPGNAYDNIISRILSCEHVNLGFSGSARGEKEIAEYIASLDMSAFIFDYDHNAPNPEHLEKTHEPMFKVIRKAHPDLPVIMLSRPNYHLDGNGIRRMEIIRKTYENAVAAGDKNVYFIPGPDLIEERIRECATVDGGHPNDSGFVSMAYAVERVLKNVL